MLTSRWAALAVLFLTRVWMGFQFQSIPPIAPLLVAELGINYTQVGLLIGLYMLPGIAIAIPGALLGVAVGDRQVVMIGLALMGLGGLLTVHGGAFWPAAAGRVVSGVGAVALNVQMMKMVTDWFAGKELATAMAVLLPTWPLGIALALAVLGELGSLTSWQVAALVPVVGTALALILFAVIYRDPPPPEAEGPPRSPFAFEREEFLLSSAAGWVWMIYNGGFIISISFAPAYLTGRGASLGEAGFVSSLIMWVVMGSIPLGGIVADKLRRPYLVIAAGCVATAPLLWTLPWQAGAVLWFALIGIGLGLPAGPIMSLPGQVLPPQRRGVGLGIYFTWYYIGMTGFPPLAGAIQDATGGATMTMHFAGLLMLLTVFALLVFALVRRKQGV
jgi:predicted MFS family arabinose efflux permease